MRLTAALAPCSEKRPSNERLAAVENRARTSDGAGPVDRNIRAWQSRGEGVASCVRDRSDAVQPNAAPSSHAIRSLPRRRLQGYILHAYGRRVNAARGIVVVVVDANRLFPARVDRRTERRRREVADSRGPERLQSARWHFIATYDPTEVQIKSLGRFLRIIVVIVIIIIAAIHENRFGIFIMPPARWRPIRPTSER